MSNGEIPKNLFEYFELDVPKVLYEYFQYVVKKDAQFIAREYLDKVLKLNETQKVKKREYVGTEICHICEGRLGNTQIANLGKLNLQSKSSKTKPTIQVTCAFLAK